MKKETAIRIAALFDGEADSTEKAELRALMQRDPEAQAYWDQLKELSRKLQGSHYAGIDAAAQWNAFSRRRDKANPAGQKKLLYFPRLATAAAALVALGIGIWFPGRKIDSTTELETGGLDHAVYMVETDLENATPIVYIDEPSGWTVVWVVEQDAHDPVDG